MKFNGTELMASSQGLGRMPDAGCYGINPFGPVYYSDHHVVTGIEIKDNVFREILGHRGVLSSYGYAVVPRPANRLPRKGGGNETD